MYCVYNGGQRSGCVQNGVSAGAEYLCSQAALPREERTLPGRYCGNAYRFYGSAPEDRTDDGADGNSGGRGADKAAVGAV